MAQFLNIFSVLFLLAAINLDNLATSLTSADDALSNVSDVRFPTGKSNKDSSTFNSDPESTRLEKLITERLSDINRFEKYAEIGKRGIGFSNEYLCQTGSLDLNQAQAVAPIEKGGYKSSWRLEYCLKPGTKCGEHINVKLPKHLTGTCHTRYIYQHITAPDGTISSNEEYSVGCECKVKSNN